MLEVLYEVPRRESDEKAMLLMEGLTILRPRLVQTLLEHCASVKVKRRFMVSAERCKYAWVNKPDLSHVMDIEGIERLPAVPWKVKNIRHMSEKKRAESLEKLTRVLGA